MGALLEELGPVGKYVLMNKMCPHKSKQYDNYQQVGPNAIKGHIFFN